MPIDKNTIDAILTCVSSTTLDTFEVVYIILLADKVTDAVRAVPRHIPFPTTILHHPGQSALNPVLAISVLTAVLNTPSLPLLALVKAVENLRRSIVATAFPFKPVFSLL
jgi:hypothetical protein